MTTAVLVAILAFAVLSFLFEWMSIDVTALATLGLLLLFGLVSGQEAVQGFANPAVITVMMLFVLSEGLVRSGVVKRLGHRIIRSAESSHRRASILLLLLAGAVSGFINNTAAVSILIPVALQLSSHFGKSASKILLPLSHVGILGGTLTLIGTSTNLLVASMAEERGIAPFTVFEFFPLGLVFLGVGLAYLLAVGLRALPERRPEDSVTRKFGLEGYLTELEVPPESELVGSTLGAEEVGHRYDLTVLEVLRADEAITTCLGDLEIEPGDILVVRGRPSQLFAFRDFFALGLAATETGSPEEVLGEGPNALGEVQVAPRSALVGHSLAEVSFRSRFDAAVLAVGRAGHNLRAQLSSVRLRPWDLLLVFARRDQLRRLRDSDEFVAMEELDLEVAPPRRWWLPLVVVPLAVGLAATGVMPILVASIIAVGVLLVAGPMTSRDAYRAVDWSVIFLIACLIPLSTAMERTGLAADLGRGVVVAGQELGPVAVLSLVYLVTAVVTEVLSNNAAAILMVPVALTTAGALGVDPKPFLMAVCYAGSAAFLTPMGYQTNAMVFAPGGYRFMDYVRVGWPLKVLLWLVATALIPVFWPL